jgi:hypothetical protein
MKRIASHRPSPAMVVALTALFFAVSGVGYATTQLSSGGPKAKSSKKSKSKRGPAGPAGPQGAAGANGAAGAAGSPGAITFTGRINALTTANGSGSFGASTGITTSTSPEATMLTLSPAAALTVTSFSVRTSSVSPDAIRIFNLRANGSNLLPCVVPQGTILCVSSPASVPMPALAELSIGSTVAGVLGTFNAAPSDAEFSWTAK